MIRLEKSLKVGAGVARSSLGEGLVWSYMVASVHL